MLCRKHPWSTYSVFQTTITSWSLFYDLGLAWLWWVVTSEWVQPTQLAVRAAMYLWIFVLCRLIKYVEHFVRYPCDLVYVPLVPLFGYFHSLCIKAYAAITLNVVSCPVLSHRIILSHITHSKPAMSMRLAKHKQFCGSNKELQHHTRCCGVSLGRPRMSLCLVATTPLRHGLYQVGVLKG